MGMSRRSAVLAAVISSSPAMATWSIVLCDTRTGEVAVGSATCLTDRDLQALTPVLLVGIGGATAQAAADTTQRNRTLIRQGLAAGTSPTEILAGLATFDLGSHQTRQYGIADVTGRAATFSGSSNFAWAGGRTGTFEYEYAGKRGTIVYAIQGNILTGEPVVLSALSAAQSTDGDVPARLMAAMEAARTMGGDGRCSCAPDDATGCGVPPASFTKSAHVGYLLVARAGDQDGTHAVLRAGVGAAQVATGEFTGDARPDLLSVNTGQSGLSFFTNTTGLNRDTPQFSLASAVGMFSGTQALSILDLNRDGKQDVLTADLTGGAVSFRRGNGNGTFANRAGYLIPGGPGLIASADFDGVNGPDMAVGLVASNAIHLRLNNGSGGFPTPLPEIALNAQPSVLIAQDLGADGRADLLVAIPSQSKLVVHRGNGDGSFQSAADVATAGAASAVVTGDIDHDNDVDLAVLIPSAPPRFQVLLNTAGVFSAGGTFVLPGARDLAMGDVDSDGHQDVVVTLGATRFAVWRGAGNGNFTETAPVEVGWPLDKVTLADLDNDFDLDAVFSLTGLGEVAVVTNRGAGRFDSGVGTAFGDYFLSFNVPNQSATAPDPVFQLRDRFDAWRAALAGRPDAVQSVVDVPSDLFPSGLTRDLTIQLRDWRGLPSTAAIASVVVTAVQDEEFITLGATQFEDGVGYRVPLTPGATVGSATITIVVNDGQRAVTLMPKITASVRACPADVNTDQGVTIEDLIAYLTLFAGGDVGADLDDGSGRARADGGVTIDDLIYFLQRYEIGC